jgi:hypothetical protein
LFISSISSARAALSMFPIPNTKFAKMTNLMFVSLCISNNELDLSDSRWSNFSNIVLLFLKLDTA